MVFVNDVLSTTFPFYGAYQPVAWDGINQHLYTSITNNCRYYGIQATPHVAPTATAGFGFSTATGTSNNVYPEHAAFVQPGLVPVIQYVTATGLYEITALQVAGTTISVADTVSFSQTLASTAFLRHIFSTPDNPTFICYGTRNVSGTYTAEAWSVTMDAAGTLTTPSSLGMCTPTSSPYAGTSFLNLHTPLVFSDRLGIDPSTQTIVDNQNPTSIIDAAAVLGTTGTTRFYANARLRPGHLVTVAGGNGLVSDRLVSPDGTSATTEATWTPPGSIAMTVACAMNDGTVTALVHDTGGTWRTYLDIFGDIHEDTGLQRNETASGGVLYVEPAFTGTRKSWMVSGNAGWPYMTALNSLVSQVGPAPLVGSATIQERARFADV